jgi:hypothetical protein
MKGKNRLLEFKSVPKERAIKDVDVKQGIVTGYAAVFDLIDEDNEYFVKGAFARTIQARGPQGTNVIKHYWDHTEPIGKPVVLKEDDYGLYFESKIAPTRRGQDVLMLYESGVIDQHSVGFKTIQDRRDDTKQGAPRALIEVKLYEITTTGFGAQEATPFLGMKSLSDVDAMIEHMSKIASILKRDASDELKEDIEFQISVMQKNIIDFLKSLTRSAQERATVDPTSISELHSMMDQQQERIKRMMLLS